MGRELSRLVRKGTTTTLGFIELGYIVSTSVVLTVNQGTCNKPIRAWLWGLLCVFSLHLLLSVVSEVLSTRYPRLLTGKVGFYSSALNCLLGFFMVIWFVLGNVWYYTLNENCEGDFYEGYILTYVILTVYYCCLGSACCMGCLLVILISLGTGITNKASDY